MELDELKKDWQARDALLTEQLRVNNQLLRATYVDSHATGLRRTNRLNWFYWLILTLTLLALGSFIADNIDQPKFFIPALLIQLWVVIMNGCEIYQQQAVKHLDFSAPVLILQGQLEKIRQRRLRMFKWGFLTGQIVWWIPLAIVLLQGLFDVDLYEVNDFMPRFMLLNVVGGIVAIPVMLTASDFIYRRFGHVSALKRIIDSLSGRDMQESLNFINRLQEFEQVTKPQL